jgi:hypothetical protein
MAAWCRGMGTGWERRPLQSHARLEVDYLVRSACNSRGGRVEAVLLGRCSHPKGHGRCCNKADFDNGFAALDAVCLWHHQPSPGTVLVGPDSAIGPHGEHGEGVHSLVKAEKFRPPRPGHGPGAGHG